MAQVLLALALVVVAVAVAFVLQRRRPDGPTQPPQWSVPAQLDRSDFARPDAPWLVAVFTSSTCSTCASVADKVAALASAAVATDQVEAVERADVHRRYHIDAVPTTVIADAAGVVRASFLGPVTAADLWAAMAELR